MSKAIKTKDASLTSPPGSPSMGDVYIIAPSATGAWASKDRQIATAAAEDGGSWVYRSPETGETFFDEATGYQWIYDGTNWIGLIAPFHFELQERSSTKNVVKGPGGQDIAKNILQQPAATDLKLIITRAWIGHDSGDAPSSRPQYQVGESKSPFGTEHEFASGQDGHEWLGSIVTPLATIPGAASPEGLGFGFTVGTGTLNTAYQCAVFDGWWVKVM